MRLKTDSCHVPPVHQYTSVLAMRVELLNCMHEMCVVGHAACCA